MMFCQFIRMNDVVVVVFGVVWCGGREAIQSFYEIRLSSRLSCCFGSHFFSYPFPGCMEIHLDAAQAGRHSMAGGGWL